VVAPEPDRPTHWVYSVADAPIGFGWQLAGRLGSRFENFQICVLFVKKWKKCILFKKLFLD
jgi:hypothetical protein